jgi:membrane protease YdiL (CAAX protease family)
VLDVTAQFRAGYDIFRFNISIQHQSQPILSSMPDSDPSPESKSDTPRVPANTATLHRYEWLGVLVVVAFCVAPDFRNSLLSWNLSTEISMSIAEIMIAIIYRSAKVSIVVCVVMVILKTRRESIGFLPPRWQDLSSAVVIWLAGSVAYYAAAVCLLPVNFQTSDVFVSVNPPSRWDDCLLLVIGSLANGFAEETVIRGYLLTRFERLLNSTFAAVFITTVLFAAYHLYQGIVPMVGVFVLGLVYAGAFCYLRRLWPLIIAHAIADFVGFMSL